MLPEHSLNALSPFDLSEEALYYARVIEIPAPRHSTYAAKLLGVGAPEPSSIQECAVTSAIWVQSAVD